MHWSNRIAYCAQLATYSIYEATFIYADISFIITEMFTTKDLFRKFVLFLIIIEYGSVKCHFEVADKVRAVEMLKVNILGLNAKRPLIGLV